MITMTNKSCYMSTLFCKKYLMKLLFQVDSAEYRATIQVLETSIVGMG